MDSQSSLVVVSPRGDVAERCYAGESGQRYFDRGPVITASTGISVIFKFEAKGEPGSEVVVYNTAPKFTIHIVLLLPRDRGCIDAIDTTESGAPG